MLANSTPLNHSAGKKILAFLNQLSLKFQKIFIIDVNRGYE